MKARTGILGLTTLALAAGTAAAAGPAVAAPAGHAPKPAARTHQAALDAVPFSSVVNIMGHTRDLIGSYAGQLRTRSGRLIVYVARSNPAPFTGELAHLARAPHSRAGGAYTVVTVRHSYAQLMSVSASLTSAFKPLRAQGIRLAQWGPDPRSNKVQITLENYSKHAVRVLMRRYGAGMITVRHTSERWSFGNPGRAVTPQATRFTDTLPFYAGDVQWYGTQPSSNACTSGFAFSGKNTGTIYGLASGHCVKDAGAGPSSFVHTNTSSTQMVGQIQTQYFPSTQYDIASVSGGPFSPHVYGNGSTTYNVLAKVFPEKGDEVTISGRKTGEVRGVTVENTDNNISVYGHPVTAVTLATKPGTVVCQEGDSGGPWFVHDGNTNGVWAAGIQNAFRVDLDTDLNDYSVCAYQQIGNVLAKVGGNLLTN
jgi:hypothetical protein